MPSIAPTSSPRVGCTAIIDRWLAGNLACQDDPLQIAAGEQAHGSIDGGHDDVVGCLQVCGELFGFGCIYYPTVGDRAFKILFHDDVVSHAQVRRAANVGAVFWDISQALLDAELADCDC